MLKKSELKNNGKLKVPKGLVIKGQGVQDIYGPKADILKSDIQDILDSGEVIPETLPSQVTAVQKGKIVSPVAGKVSSIFPTKHALGLVSDNGLEVLVHIGLDTVSLEGKPFEVKVTEGQTVAAGDLLVEADLAAIREAGRETSTVVVFTNTDAIKSVKVEHTEKLAANAPVAKVEL